MSDTQVYVKKTSSWGRKLLIIAAALVVLLVLAYFGATSGAFFKSVILPKAGQALNADITVGDASISPFSAVTLKQLKVTPRGQETLLEAGEINLRYSLMDILGGKITVTEATVTSPVITVIQKADGTSNLDPLLKSQTQTAPSQPAAKSEPLNLNVKGVSLKNARLTFTQTSKDGSKTSAEIPDLTLTLDQLISGQPSKLGLQASLKLDQVPAPGAKDATPAHLEAKASTDLSFKLDPNLMPESALGSTRLEVTAAQGAAASLAALAVVLDTDLSAREIRKLNVRFEQSGVLLGEIRASGPLALATQEGKIKIEVSNLDRKTLNLVGMTLGLDFNSGVVNAVADLDLAQQGAVIAGQGQVKIESLKLTETKTGRTTPTLGVQADYQFALDRKAETLVLKSLQLTGSQNNHSVLSGRLTKPMTLALSSTAGAPDEAAFNLAVTALKIEDWSPFVPDLAPAGMMTMLLDVTSRQAGQDIEWNLQADLQGLEATLGSNRLTKADAMIVSRGAVASLKTVNLQDASLRLNHSGESVLSLKSAGTLNLDTLEASLKTGLETSLKKLVELLAIPDASLSSGAFRFDGQVTQTKAGQTIVGQFAVANLSGKVSGMDFQRMQVAFDGEFDLKPESIVVRKLAGTLEQAGQPGGSFNLTAEVNPKTTAGQAEIKLQDINQVILRSILAPALGDKQLESAALNTQAKATFQAGGNATFNAAIDLSKLSVKDPKNPKFETLSAAKLAVDGSFQKQVLDLKQLQITLSPTARAKNQLEVKGQLDLSQSNALQGKLAISAESLDLTPLYDLVAPKADTNAPAAAEPPPVAKPSQEPDALQLPIKDLTASLNIGQVYLREVEIKDWQANIRVQGSQVTVNPFQLQLNGAPVKLNAALNLGVPGYQYDVSLNIDKAPLEPLANSFASGLAPGQVQGLLIANAAVKGAGVTGKNLRSNLAGQVLLQYTNANIQIMGKRFLPLIKTVALLLGVNEILNTPLNGLLSQIDLGGGNITLRQTQVTSDAFEANIQGVIPIADELMDSPLNKLPVAMSLRRSLAEKINMVPANTPKDAKMVPLPSFAKLTGTLGKPEADLNKLALGGMALRSVTRIIPGAGEVEKKAGGVLNVIGNLVPGAAPAPAPAPATNNVLIMPTPGAAPAAPATNSLVPAVKSILNLFPKK